MSVVELENKLKDKLGDEFDNRVEAIRKKFGDIISYELVLKLLEKDLFGSSIEGTIVRIYDIDEFSFTRKVKLLVNGEEKDIIIWNDNDILKRAKIGDVLKIEKTYISNNILNQSKNAKISLVAKELPVTNLLSLNNPSIIRAYVYDIEGLKEYDKGSMFSFWITDGRNSKRVVAWHLAKQLSNIEQGDEIIIEYPIIREDNEIHIIKGSRVLIRKKSKNYNKENETIN